MKKIKETFNVKITTFASKAGWEVLRIYGLLSEVQKISPGGYYEEFFVSEKNWSFPVSGRLQLGRYQVLMISPCSGNTVAKIVHGIADTLVTNVFAQAQKGNIPIYVLPTEQHPGETELPYTVNRDRCRGCIPCPPMEVCKYGAVELKDGKARINLEKCWGCGLCLPVCPFGAVVFGEKVGVKPREVDVENIKKLRRMKGVTVLNQPKELEKILEDIFKGSC